MTVMIKVGLCQEWKINVPVTPSSPNLFEINKNKTKKLQLFKLSIGTSYSCNQMK